VPWLVHGNCTIASPARRGMSVRLLSMTFFSSTLISSAIGRLTPAPICLNVQCFSVTIQPIPTKFGVDIVLWSLVNTSVLDFPYYS